MTMYMGIYVCGKDIVADHSRKRDLICCISRDQPIDWRASAMTISCAVSVKSRKYLVVFGVHFLVKIRQVWDKVWSQQVEYMPFPIGTAPGSGGVSVHCRHASPVADTKWKTYLQK